MIAEKSCLLGKGREPRWEGRMVISPIAIAKGEGRRE